MFDRRLHLNGVAKSSGRFGPFPFWPTIVLCFQLVIAVSRFWCVWKPISYQRFWTQRNTQIISITIWTIGFLFSLHIVFFVPIFAYNQNQNNGTSLAFKAVTPNYIYALVAVYVRGAIVITISLLYLAMAFVLWRLSTTSRLKKSNLWTVTTKRIVITQIVSLFPKHISICFAIYWYLWIFFPSLQLPPMNISLYFLQNKFQGVGYGILVTIAIVFCFPTTMDELQMFFRRHCCRSSRISLSNSKISIEDTAIFTTFFTSTSSIFPASSVSVKIS